MTFSIKISRHAQRALGSIPKRDSQRIAVVINQLANDPRPRWSLKLKGHSAYRIAVGDYRVIFEVSDEKNLVEVLKIADRKSAYRDL